MDESFYSCRRSKVLSLSIVSLLFLSDLVLLLFLIVFLPSYGFAQVEIFEYEYDIGQNGVGQLHSVIERMGGTTVGSMVFSYDVRGNITQTDRIIEGNPTPYTIKSTYDSLNRPVDLTYPDNDTLRHSYNSQGLLDSVVSLTSGTNYVSLDYNVLGQITSKKLGNNRTTTYIYHPQNFRLTDLITPGIQSFRYKYDNVGNIEEINDNKDPATPKIQTFGYDTRHQLTSASSGAAPSYGHTYQYDTINNMKIFTAQSSSGPIETTFIYPIPFNFSSRPHAVQGDGTSSYGYDSNGNMTLKRTGDIDRIFVWNNNNQLIRVEQSNTVLAEFTYDHAGQRMTKKAANQVTLYADGRYECVSDGVNFTPASSTCTKYIFAGNQRIASRIAGSTTSPIHYYYRDHLGSTTLVTNFLENNPETALKELAYFPYGSLRVNLPPDTEIAYKYNDKELDEEIGLYYYGARYYDPALMRFISPDTVDPDRNYPQTLNRYSYVRNNPLKFVDPTGKAERDFHYYISGYLFYKGGFPAEIANQIARANQGVDDSWGTNPLLNFWRPSVMIHLHAFHPDNGDTKYVERYNQEFLGRALLAASRHDWKTVGDYMHFRMDMPFHSGSNLVSGGFKFPIGHIGVWHKADWPFMQIPKARQLYRDAYEIVGFFCEAAKICDKERPVELMLLENVISTANPDPNIRATHLFNDPDTHKVFPNDPTMDFLLPQYQWDFSTSSPTPQTSCNTLSCP
ncbi:MAG: RHS repeat-associated core domain-containing protein [Candidatus Manganitrophus sp.]|nr:RHS repeat-associated core domain-containing protein [Candidatus Manganitrophus sp.]MDC4223158.1 RHS repeat-associated core domain-containing protein [Candidatus Manganitrophus sp.]WDT69451.1 MAG: RHS repeat-associated core domain-containing protein [Candidatus Manganitrophus sp.]WDT78958.1 MAG: RHS repeat-associated core domain-containing protein [Candidatus Manganitrophus sp.]